MKASHGNNRTEEISDAIPVKKAPKAAGPFRFEAAVPVSILFGLIFFYFLFFFDFHLRRGLEYLAGRAHGAEVNIGSLDTDILDLSIELNRIQVTDAGKPENNLIEIEKIHFEMLADALIRGKIVIEDASIENILFRTIRESPGDVYDSTGSLTLLQNKFSKIYSDNILGELAAFASGKNSAADLQEKAKNLESGKKIQALTKNLEEKRIQWQKRIDAMPTEEKIKSLEKRINTITKNKKQKPLEIVASLKELNEIRKELRSYSNTVKESKNAIETDSRDYYNTIRDLNKIIEEDVRSLQNKLKIPRFDKNSLAGSLFGNVFQGYLYMIKEYADTARGYMPVQEEPDELIKIEPPDRSLGTDYIFGTPKSYPSFWLKRAKISSQKIKQFSSISGEIQNLSTNPSAVGKPFIITLKGSLPEKQIMNVTARAQINHSKNIPSETFILEIQKYPVSKLILSKSQDTEFILDQAVGSLNLTAGLSGEKVRIKSENRFSRLKFKTSAKSELLNEVLTSAVPNIKTITLNASAEGTWKNLDIKMSSNLATILEEEFRKFLKDKLSAAQRQLEDIIKKEVSSEHKTLLSEYKKTDVHFKQEIVKKQNQLLNLEKELARSQTDLNKQKTKNAIPENLLKQDTMDLLKQF
ncbi:MAG: TIGR03545 family protein [Spirochaetia bacterium]|nr:TIGR03545 family protein [Spirochaetia bacterium]